MQWAVSEESPDFTSGHVTLGLLLDAEHAYSLLDMGPAADGSEVGIVCVCVFMCVSGVYVCLLMCMVCVWLVWELVSVCVWICMYNCVHVVK